MTNPPYDAIIWLTHGRYAIVDVEDYEWLSKGKWQLHKGRYARNGNLHVAMHREILRAPKKVPTDHINGNGLDNRKSNLRLCTSRQNSFNRGASRINTTGFKGVIKKWNNSFVAEIRSHPNVHHLGTYKTAREAAVAYDEAALRLHGEFAKTNKMLGLL